MSQQHFALRSECEQPPASATHSTKRQNFVHMTGAQAQRCNSQFAVLKPEFKIPRAMRSRPSALVVAVCCSLTAPLSRVRRLDAAELKTKSGIGTWVDPATPYDRQVYVSSRGAPRELVMSDEFNMANRSFKPGEDHMWTSVEKPNGVNAALEIYSHNMTSTACDADGTCYFYIKAVDEEINVTVWNDYQNPPGYKNVSFFYRAAMVQSWNKFCFQGGMVEVRTQLSGAVSKASGNPDITGPSSARTATVKYYPTWPGIWMMGNLGRAIFSASTARMWPFSYNECNDAVFKSSNQRIGACDANPGSGMNPNQGRGAPEIDIIEGSGLEISTSMQVGLGMATDFRRFYASGTDYYSCFYTGACTTLGANSPGVPVSTYAKRNYKTWYQGMKYAANNFCTPNATFKQDYKVIKASVDKGVTENVCTLTTCPGSKDVSGDLGLIDNSAARGHWGINSNGTCYPVLNGYQGSYLCSPGNPSTFCEKSEVAPTSKPQVFGYQMDALSANWPIHVGVYLGYLVYQLEWVMDSNGYVRWMLAGQPIYEIPASALTSPPQNSAKSNPVKLMVEEPMYMIFNVALSSTWGATPPNPGKVCRDDGKDAVVNKICNEFPMLLKVDYIRVYQDTSPSSSMQVGYDPKSHPTKQWILDNIESYEDANNKAVDVSGWTFCSTDDDCAIARAGRVAAIRTGTCFKNRCKCSGSSWTGPRCTNALSSSNADSFGPSLYVTVPTFSTVLFVTLVVICVMRKSNKVDRLTSAQRQQQQKAAAMAGSYERLSSNGDKLSLASSVNAM